MKSDIMISTIGDHKKTALNKLINLYKNIEEYIKYNPEFENTMTPIEPNDTMPLIIHRMVVASKKAGVGPMACVAGIISEELGNELAKYSQEVIVENGGDIFIKSNIERRIALFSGESPLNMKIGIKLNPGGESLGICTSSGTVGHSISYGNADAAVCLCEDVALADAAATSVGNKVISKEDIEKGLVFAKSLNEIKGCVIIFGKKIGAWGDVEICKLD